jgi:hypothetical protein
VGGQCKGVGRGEETRERGSRQKISRRSKGKERKAIMQHINTVHTVCKKNIFRVSSEPIVTH